MPEDLGEGLYLTAVGMGLIFLSLVVIMLVLLALRRLFPGEEVAESIETDEALVTVERVKEQQASDQRSPGELQEPSADSGGPTEGRMPGAKIAAMAVALYLAMEQEEYGTHTPVVSSAWTPAQNYSGWGVLGRASQWGSQGRRPQAYGQRSQSAYPPRGRLRE
jgi:Na+-transporting methylmalonyl-CoA/oxaloacetate decarboxylase gamma subunit